MRHRDHIAGRIAFVFQPADEPMRGAKRMIEDGVLEQVKPDMSLSVPRVPELFATLDNDAYLSTVSAWEIAVKHALGAGSERRGDACRAGRPGLLPRRRS